MVIAAITDDQGDAVLPDAAVCHAHDGQQDLARRSRS